MQLIGIIKVVLCVALCLPSVALAWARHDLVTLAAIEKLVLSQAAVPFVPLSQAVSGGSSLTARSPHALKRALKINKSFVFRNHLNESAGQQVFVRSILSKYADEPDWGPDENLFADHQYPELWNDDMNYIARKEGTGSTGFRHMYFPGKLDWTEPVSSFQIPMRPLGEAPERFAVFYDLARDFFKRGQHYWGYRFLAWALHYVEDLYQPFHVRQCPSKSFMAFSFKWAIIPSLDIAKSADQIEYYHLSYERWISHRHEQLKTHLQQLELAAPFQGPPVQFAKDYIVAFSSRYAKRIGEYSYRYFPRLVAQTGIDVSEKIGTKQWWKTLGSEKQANVLLENTESIFVEMGQTIRRLVVDSH